MNRSVEALTTAARRRRERAESAVEKALKEARKTRNPVSVTSIARAAGVSTDFIYRHPVLRPQVEALRRARCDAAPDDAAHQPCTRPMLPGSALLCLEAKLRQIHAERPDLEGPEVVNMAFDVLEGEKIDARLAMEEARARVDEAAAGEARLASMQRIAERSAELDAVEARYPGRATMAEALADGAAVAAPSWQAGRPAGACRPGRAGSPAGSRRRPRTQRPRRHLMGTHGTVRRLTACPVWLSSKAIRPAGRPASGDRAWFPRGVAARHLAHLGLSRRRFIHP